MHNANGYTNGNAIQPPQPNTLQPPPYRVQMKFWLDANREDERELGFYLDTMKQQRKYVSTIRDAIRLIKSLREGRADVLLELFPQVQDMINRHHMETLFKAGREDVTYR